MLKQTYFFFINFIYFLELFFFRVFLGGGAIIRFIYFFILFYFFDGGTGD